jgi:prolyl-tRNA synthetase
VHLDKRDIRGGEKSWQWIKKGIPLRLEVGPRDIENDQVVLYRRDKAHKEKLFLKKSELKEKVVGILDDIQQSMFNSAKSFLDANINRDIKSFAEFKEFFTAKNPNKPEIHGGFVFGKWCGDEEVTAELLSELKVTVRCLPLEQSGTTGKCVLTGKNATIDAIFAKAY